MKLRSLVESDIAKIDEFWRKHIRGTYSLPDRQNAIVDAVTENSSGRVVGYGQVKLFAEAMLFLDPTAPKRERAESLKLLMAEAFRGVNDAGINEIYCFIRDPQFANLIGQRYGFKVIEEPGTLLLKTR